MQDSHQQLKGVLVHVLWIGGPPDSGKTSIAAALVEKHKLQAYHFDRHEMEDFRRAAHNVIQRDLLMAEDIWRQVQTHGLIGIEVDGSVSIDKMTCRVEEHFGPSLLVR